VRADQQSREGNIREILGKLVSKGKASARELTRARILLKVDQGEYGPAWTDQGIGKALDVNIRTTERVRQRFVEQGLEVAFNRRRGQQGLAAANWTNARR
jgi:hypothetical protein